MSRLTICERGVLQAIQAGTRSTHCPIQDVPGRPSKALDARQRGLALEAARGVEASRAGGARERVERVVGGVGRRPRPRRRRRTRGRREGGARAAGRARRRRGRASAGPGRPGVAVAAERVVAGRALEEVGERARGSGRARQRALGEHRRAQRLAHPQPGDADLAKAARPALEAVRRAQSTRAIRTRSELTSRSPSRQPVPARRGRRSAAVHVHLARTRRSGRSRAGRSMKGTSRGAGSRCSSQWRSRARRRSASQAVRGSPSNAAKGRCSGNCASSPARTGRRIERIPSHTATVWASRPRSANGSRTAASCDAARRPGQGPAERSAPGATEHERPAPVRVGDHDVGAARRRPAQPGCAEDRPRRRSGPAGQRAERRQGRRARRADPSTTAGAASGSTRTSRRAVRHVVAAHLRQGARRGPMSPGGAAAGAPARSAGSGAPEPLLGQQPGPTVAGGGAPLRRMSSSALATTDPRPSRRSNGPQLPRHQPLLRRAASTVQSTSDGVQVGVGDDRCAPPPGAR